MGRTQNIVERVDSGIEGSLGCKVSIILPLLMIEEGREGGGGISDILRLSLQIWIYEFRTCWNKSLEGNLISWLWSDHTIVDKDKRSYLQGCDGCEITRALIWILQIGI